MRRIIFAFLLLAAGSVFSAEIESALKIEVEAKKPKSRSVSLVTQVMLARVLLSAPSTGGWDYFNEHFRGMNFYAIEYKDYPVAQRGEQSVAGLTHVVVAAGTLSRLIQVVFTVGPLHSSEKPIELLLSEDDQIRQVCTFEEGGDLVERYYAYRLLGGQIYMYYYRGDAPGGRIESVAVGGVSLPPECTKVAAN